MTRLDLRSIETRLDSGQLSTLMNDARNMLEELKQWYGEWIGPRGVVPVNPDTLEVLEPGARVTKLPAWRESTPIAEPDGFHELWGQAKASPEYDKQKWIAFQDRLIAAAKRADEIARLQAHVAELIDQIAGTVP